LGIRQTLDENRRFTTVGTVVVVILAVLYIAWFMRPPAETQFASREFFSDDDGTTWFVDDGMKVPPFDHNGKPAVLAKVYKCRDGRVFVGYLEKFSDEARRRIEATRSSGHGGPQAGSPGSASDVLLKKPHEGTWVAVNDPAAMAIRMITCPGGGRDFVPVPP
jgi:hypothetical protein